VLSLHPYPTHSHRPAPRTSSDPVDEPSPTLLATGDYTKLVQLLKQTAPAIPIIAVVTESAVKGIEFHAYDLPPEVDWVGFDAYGCWGTTECADYGECCWENRTVPHNLHVMETYANKRGGGMLVVPDGVSLFPPNTAANVTVPVVDQQRRAARDQKFYNFCVNSTACVAYLPFLWTTIPTSGALLKGVASQPVLLHALSQIGSEIKHAAAVAHETADPSRFSLVADGMSVHP
jgi:hypothetical protein